MQCWVGNDYGALKQYQNSIAVTFIRRSCSNSTCVLSAQGFRCTLQQRPSCSSARLTPKSNARGTGGRPVSSALGRLENSPGRGTRAMSRPVTAPGGGGRRRDPGQRPGAQIRDRTGKHPSLSGKYLIYSNCQILSFLIS